MTGARVTDGTQATRLVVSDPPGSPSRVTLYRDGDALAYVELDPASAIGAAGDLIEAARVRLGRARSDAAA